MNLALENKDIPLLEIKDFYNKFQTFISLIKHYGNSMIEVSFNMIAMFLLEERGMGWGNYALFGSVVISVIFISFFIGTFN